MCGWVGWWVCGTVKVFQILEIFHNELMVMLCTGLFLKWLGFKHYNWLALAVLPCRATPGAGALHRHHKEREEPHWKSVQDPRAEEWDLDRDVPAEAECFAAVSHLRQHLPTLVSLIPLMVEAKALDPFLPLWSCDLMLWSCRRCSIDAIIFGGKTMPSAIPALIFS